MEAATMLTVKCGRDEVQLSNNDEIMFNGACYQITSRKSFYQSAPIIAKSTAKKLIRAGLLVLHSKGNSMGMDIEIYKVSGGRNPVSK